MIYDTMFTMFLKSLVQIYGTIILGAVADNVGIVFYSYAMAINSVSTDPLIAIYPIFVMIGGRVIMKEKVSAAQVLLLLGIVTGSIMIVLDTVF